MSAYLCIDLKTFYASVECVERSLDPFKTNLVVADPSRGQGALCLAISPKMKAQGVKNRCRLFEIPKHIQYEIALPRMKLYMEYSAKIYSIYLKYVAKEDIHVYSIDEAFLFIDPYLKMYNLKPVAFAKMIMDDILEETGITATCGIGTNLYLCKIALDITAKHSSNNLGILNVEKYRKELWHHKPLTDFWHIGSGISARLERLGIHDMWDIAHCDQQILYKEFGINAEYMIDHAWGIEPTTIAEIHSYHSTSSSISHSQVLFEDYDYEHALLAIKEMVELKVLDLVSKHLVTRHISLYVGYSKNAIKGTGGSRKLDLYTNSYVELLDYFEQMFRKTTNPSFPIRQLGIGFGDLVDEMYTTYDLFSDIEKIESERNLQRALVEIKGKYGKNAVFKGMNLLDKATTLKRNQLVGGHNAE